MLKNCFKTAFRYLWNHKVFSGINLAGLAIGMCVCFFTLMYVNFELSYDSYHEKADNIYRLVTDVQTSTGINYESTSAPMAPAIQASCPDVKVSTRIFLDNLIIEKDEHHFNDETIAYADSSLFAVFTLPLISGDPATVLNAPYKIVLSESAARKYFGSDNPIGKTLLIEGKYPAAVTGLMKDMPMNSHFRADILVSLSTLIQEWNPGMAKNWNRFGFYSYLLLNKNASLARLSAQLAELIKKHADQSQVKYTLSLEPLKSVYLQGKTRGHRTGTSASGNINNLYIFSIVAALVLFIACFNFINLTTALSLQRAKEIGVRKVLGASKKQLIGQFLLDAVLLSLFAFLLALLMCILLLPLFNQLLGKNIGGYIGDHVDYIGGLLLIAVFIGLLSGIYPAFFLSGFLPVSTLKGRFATGAKGVLLRKSLIVTQFSLSIGLIIATIVVYSQLHFMENQQLGFKKDHNLVIDFHFDDRISQHEASIKQQLTDIPGVSFASISSCVPGKANRRMDTKIENVNRELQDFQLEPYFIDYDFLQQYQIEVVAGRSFSGQFSTDSSEAMLINETAMKSLGYPSAKDALGKRFAQAGRNGFIIGVLKDFHFHSFREPVQPLTFQLGSNFLTFMTLNISSKELSPTIDRLTAKWKELAPGLPLVYFFEDEMYNTQYLAEERFGKLFICWALLAIFLSSLGLLGLSVFNTQQRTKEIGIRKISGASVKSLIAILSIDYMKLVCISFVIAAPLAAWVMNRWLQSFAYRIELAWWMLALAGFNALLVAFVTISLQTFRAAGANPIKSLRAE